MFAGNVNRKTPGKQKCSKKNEKTEKNKKMKKKLSANGGHMADGYIFGVWVIEGVK